MMRVLYINAHRSVTDCSRGGPVALVDPVIEIMERVQVAVMNSEGILLSACLNLSKRAVFI